MSAIGKITVEIVGIREEDESGVTLMTNCGALIADVDGVIDCGLVTNFDFPIALVTAIRVKVDGKIPKAG